MQKTFIKVLHHLVVPSRKNNHRARALHLDFLAGYLVFSLIFSGAYFGLKNTNLAGRVLGYASDVSVGALYSLVNDVRVSHGLGRLAINSRLNNAATTKAKNMFAENYWAHVSPSGKTPWSFIRGAGYAYRVAGENLAEGYDTSGAVTNAWMNSTTHRANILRGDFSDVGYAVMDGTLQGRQTTLIVQMFGSRSSQVKKKSSFGVSSVKGDDTDFMVNENAQINEDPSEIESDLLALGKETVGDLSVVQELKSKIDKPLIDMRSLSNRMVLSVMIGLFVILLIDVAYAKKSGMLRVSGKNIAHGIFLGVILISFLLIAGPQIM